MKYKIIVFLVVLCSIFSFICVTNNFKISISSPELTAPTLYVETILYTEYSYETSATEMQAQTIENQGAYQTSMINILSDKNTFYSHSYERNLVLSEYCATWASSANIIVEIPQFTYLDLDGDSINEVILWIKVNQTSDYGVLVLRYYDGDVHGYTFTYRQMFDLKEDGTFSYSGGRNHDGIAKLRFDGDQFSYNEIIDSSQDKKTDVVWYKFPCDKLTDIIK